MTRIHRRRNRKVKCKCTKCRMNSEPLGFRFVDYRTQNRHHRRDIQLQLERDAPPSLNLQDQLQLPQQIQTPLQDEALQQSPELVHAAEMEDRGQYLKNKMKNLVIKMQAEWDSKGVPVELQEWTLHQIFEGISNTDNSDSTVSPEDRLAPLIRMIPEDWDGSLEGPHSTPSTFKTLVRLYKRWGLVQPKRWRMCLGTRKFSHEPLILPPAEEDAYDGNKYVACSCDPPNDKRTCPECANTCPHCNNTRFKMIAFDYLSIADELSSAMASRTLCHEMLTMWRANTEWLNVHEAPPSIVNVWHGEKVREYQDFWNPEIEWELPVICPNTKCRRSYCAFPVKCKTLRNPNHWHPETGCYIFMCKQCRRKQVVAKKMVMGDPRNLALAGHWDGFQVSGKKQRGCWVMEVDVLNAGTSSSLSLLPVLFIPLGGNHPYIVKRMKENITAFIRPFVEELETLFVDGMHCRYNYPVCRISNLLPRSETPNLRAIFMLMTGDHPVQCKISNLKSSGKSACRRCKMNSKLVDGQYVYGENEIQFAHPPERRTVKELRQSVDTLRRLKNDKKARGEHSMESGVSGDSELWRLYYLYRFDMSRDLVYDVMHVANLNMFKNYMIKLFQDIRQHPKADALLDLVDATCTSVTKARTYELKQGQWPRDPINDHQSYTAEECQHFVMWVLPIVLHKLEASKHQFSKRRCMIGRLLVDIAHYFFNWTRGKGWSTEDLDVVRQLLQKWRNLSEALDGPNGRPLEHVAGAAHILEDMVRFGHSDVYWCFPYEREVKRYNNIKTNQKNVEATFAKYTARRLFQKIQLCIAAEADGMDTRERALVEVHDALMYPEGVRHNHIVQCPEWHLNCCLTTSSMKKATYLLKLVEQASDSFCSTIAKSKGIMISPINNPYQQASDIVWSYLTHRLVGLDATHAPYILVHKGCMMKRYHYEAGDDVVVENDEVAGTPYKAKIKEIFSHEYNMHIETYFSVDYYQHQPFYEDDMRSDMVDLITNMNVIKKGQLCSI